MTPTPGTTSRRRRRAVAAVGVLSASVLAAGCSTGSAPGTSSSRPPTASAEVAPPPSAGGTPVPKRPRPAPLTIAVAGDVHFEGVLRDRLGDPATALAPATAALAAADVAVVNLETSVGTGGTPDPGKRYTFQAPPGAFSALAAAGVDVASMANNHALDFGRDPLPGMFDAVDAALTADPPLAVVGIGRDAEEAFRPAELDVGGTVVATIGATLADADPTADPTGHWAATDRSAGTADALDPGRLLRTVESADRSADVVLVYLHWGVQGERCPSSGQRSLAADLVEAGADIVVGSHAHVLQGDGRLGPGYVAYGLGNYAWYSQTSEAASTTGVLTLTVRPPRSPSGRASVTEAAWEPARIGTDGLPRVITGSGAAAFDADLRRLRACAGLAP
ncbi:MAG: CapA protein [uncultured Nocardioides sp.]|uniref:CapA protein n=1 Tax=uncultured Nocardioides sp. TaxID=198441 RepID=A0A6J4NJS6_9ACTN|nr:MAG: CapA protein [uncultured Nocardioides sp.]